MKNKSVVHAKQCDYCHKDLQIASYGRKYHQECARQVINERQIEKHHRMQPARYCVRCHKVLEPGSKRKSYHAECYDAMIVEQRPIKWQNTPQEVKARYRVVNRLSCHEYYLSHKQRHLAYMRYRRRQKEGFVSLDEKFDESKTYYKEEMA